MVWTICFWLAIGIFALAVIYAAVSFGINRHNRRAVSSTAYLFFGIYLSLFCIVFPIYFSAGRTEFLGVFRTIMFSMMQAIKLMGVSDISSTVNAVDKTIALYPAYTTVMTVLLAAAPIFTLTYVFSFLKRFNAGLRLFFSAKKEMVVFSDLNPESLALATDIRANHRSSMIVFTGVDPDAKSALYDSASALGAVCVRKDAAAVKLHIRSRHKAIRFFALSDDERKNTYDGMALIEKYGGYPHTALYVFSDSVESELLLNSADARQMVVRRICYPHLLVSHLLYDEGDRIFASAVPENGTKNIRALIVGTGRFGTEMLKGLVWYCQMDGFELALTAVDKKPELFDHLRVSFPELLDKHNGRRADGEPYYRLDIRSGMHSDSFGFADLLSEVRPTYVFVSLGDDDANIKAAADIRMICERIGIKPFIHAVVYSFRNDADLNSLKNFQGQPYDIRFVGNLKSRFTEKEILSSEIDRAAMEHYLRYRSDLSDFWRYEYHYRSSVASAIHRKAVAEQGLLGSKNPADNPTPQQPEALAILEHKRWMAYMRAQGYCRGRTRNDLAKVHHDLVAYDLLNEEEKQIDRRMTGAFPDSSTSKRGSNDEEI